MNIYKIVLKIFNSSVSKSKSWDILNYAFKEFEQVYAGTIAYTIRANRLYEVLLADLALSKAPGCPTANAAYYAAASEFKDSPEDFHAYTKEELDAHTAAINSLALTFDALNTAFDSIIQSKNERLYDTAISYLKSSCDLYTLAASSYSQAATCALLTALEDNAQVVKDEFECILLEGKAENSSKREAPAAQNLAIRFRAMVTEKAANAKALESVARIAEDNARIMESKAESGEARVAAALRTITTKP